jgi:poly-gamma-glutamate synthesis protein (capsule biosynthesis protein)
VQLLSAAGIDAVSLANNHTLDYRRDGLLRTIELLDDGGVAHFGAGPDSAAAYEYRLVDVDGWAVALVGFTHVECAWVADDPTRWPEAAWACPGFEDRTVAAVEAAGGAADLVVVMVHWGIQLDSCPQPRQRELAAAWVGAGADLVIGGHPHVLQGVERLGDAWVIYSTGNFAFPSARGPSARSAFFSFEVGAAGIDLTVTPVSIVSGRPVPMTDGAATDMLFDLSRWSFGWSFDQTGHPSPRQDAGACG